mgnify:FL=1
MKHILRNTLIYCAVIIIISIIVFLFLKNDKIGQTLFDYIVFFSIIGLTISLILFLINRKAYSIFSYSFKKFMYRMKPKSLQNIQANDDVMNPKSLSINPDMPYQFGGLFIASLFLLFTSGIISLFI